MKPLKSATLTVLTCLMMFLSGSSTADANAFPKGTILAELEERGEFNTLLTALEITGLDEAIAHDRLTLFAPTDSAFMKLPDGTLEFLIDNPDQLAEVLLYHVVEGRKSTFRLARQTTTETLLGEPILVANGYEYPFVNGTEIKDKNIWARNGFVHVIEEVLSVPEEPVEINSVVDILALDGRFQTLITAVTEAGLAEALSNLTNITLYAPTDEAFAKLGEDTIANLLADPDGLAEILLYHVSDKRLRALRLLVRGEAETKQGEFVEISKKERKIFINDAATVNVNLHAPNAVVHTIDTVLLPPSLSE